MAENKGIKIDFDTYLKSKDRIDFDIHMKKNGQDVIDEFHIDSVKLFFACMKTKYKNSKTYSNLKTAEEWNGIMEIHIYSVDIFDLRETVVGMKKLPHKHKVELLDDLFDKMSAEGKLKREKRAEKMKRK